ncbi:MAG: ferritin [Thermoproteota archaeon]
MARISERIQELLNRQINSELYSAYLYLSMAAYFESRNLRGFASWMVQQAREELEHAMRIYRYVFERGGRVALKAIEEPPSEWSSPRDAVKHALEHEMEVTRRIHNIYEAAREERDHATEVFMQWFVNEQVEEEALFSDLLAKVEAAGDSPVALMMLDSLLARRGEEQED